MNENNFTLTHEEEITLQDIFSDIKLNDKEKLEKAFHKINGKCDLILDLLKTKKLK